MEGSPAAVLTSVFDSTAEKKFLYCVQSGMQLTYAEVLEYSLKLAQFLRARGIHSESKIGILLSNCSEYVLLYFACAHIGAIAVPINHKLTEREINFILCETSPDLFISASSYTENFTLSIAKEKTFTFSPAIDKANFFFNNVVYDGSITPFGALSEESLFVIVYTSGTTSAPKGVMITYRNIIANGIEFIKLLGLSGEPQSVFYAYLDLAYLGGIYNLMFIPFLAQGAIVLDKTFSPQTAVSFWNTVENFGINTLWLVPSIAAIILQFDRAEKVSEYAQKKIRRVLIGTAPLSPQLREQFERRYGLTLYENYGLSETLFISTNTPAAHNDRGVGKILAGCTVFTADPNTGEPLAFGETGEIVIQSSYLMKSYFAQPERANNSLFYTGDIGYLAADGALYITDRKKDLIIRGGINVSPREIEEVLLANPAVADVAVVGVTHAYLGEEIVAFVKMKNPCSEHEIKLYCKGRLASFKIPSKIIFQEKFPLSVTGKVQKQELKRQATQGFLQVGNNMGGGN